VLAGKESLSVTFDPRWSGEVAVPGRDIGPLRVALFDPDSAFLAAMTQTPDTAAIQVRLRPDRRDAGFTMSEQLRLAWRDMVYYYEHFRYRTQ
jgi:hypothetical protein